MSTLTLRPAAPTYDLCVFIGRLSPLHNAHMAIIDEAFSHARYVLILFGSANEPRSTRNPFTWQERARMVLLSLPEEQRSRIICLPVEDQHSNDLWTEEAQKAAAKAVAHFKLSNPKIALIGHKKDHTSFYINMFPMWDNIACKNHKQFSSTAIRESYFSNIGSMWLADCDGHKEGDGPRDAFVPSAVREFLTDFMTNPNYLAIDGSQAYKYILDEYNNNTEYKAGWASAPYPPTFQTVDSVIIQSGYILLVERKASPGRGTWALPGGFVEQNERMLDAMLRELRQETKIALPEDVLRGSIVTHERFDDPHRSSRGRTITEAYLIHLKPGKLPRVKGGDDAAKAKWWLLSDVMRNMMFEDHYLIINKMKAYLEK